MLLQELNEDPSEGVILHYQYCCSVRTPTKLPLRVTECHFPEPSEQVKP